MFIYQLSAKIQSKMFSGKIINRWLRKKHDRIFFSVVFFVPMSGWRKKNKYREFHTESGDITSVLQIVSVKP